jgi:hypothetical protein
MDQSHCLGKADAINEKAFLPDFFTDIFLNLLDTAPAGPNDTFTLSRETPGSGGRAFVNISSAPEQLTLLGLRSLNFTYPLRDLL